MDAGASRGRRIIAPAPGRKGVLSAEMGRGIWSLAKVARKAEPVRRILGASKPQDALVALEAEPEAAEFLDELDRFLKKNGHRAIRELELSSPRWEENPAPVLGMVRNYLLVDADPDKHEEAVRQSRRGTGKLKYSPNWKTGFWKNSCAPDGGSSATSPGRPGIFHGMRENSRFYHIMGFYIMRRKILALEAELMAQGRLRCKGDIFHLRKRELDGLRKGELDWLDVEDVVRERRMEYIRLSKMTPPKSIGGGHSGQRPPARSGYGRGHAGAKRQPGQLRRQGPRDPRPVHGH